jgi:soluble lytic murein transglycosylase-like protein
MAITKEQHMTRFFVTLRVALVLGMVLWASPHGAAAQQADVLAAIDGAARRWGLTPRFMRCLAARESTYRPNATGRGGGMGLYQFTARTWRANAPRYGWRGHSPYDARAAAHVAAGMIAHGMLGHWPRANRCGSPRA